MKLSRPLAVVWILILAYGIFFSALSIQQHRAFLTHASDLGQIDQAIWNTLHGHLLEHTKATTVQNIRLSDHVEPIFIPISLVFLVYDNAEALLILQSFVIALGALAVFWIARTKLDAVAFPGRHPLHGNQFGPGREPSHWNEWAAVGFAAMYLLFPALEAANLAEFHAAALAPLPLLLAYYYGDRNAWGRFALFSILALAIKEEISLLVFVMALWFAIKPFAVIRRRFAQDWRGLFRAPLTFFPSRLALFIALLAVVWFVVAVFVIIPHFNALGRSPYTCRYGVGEDCPEIARGLFLQARLGYLGQLLASVGWIALLDPVSLLLGLPLLAANVLSNYPAQYSGTYHYSAPVAPYLVLAAIGGTAKLVGLLNSRLETRALSARISGRIGHEVSKHTFTYVVAPVFLLALGYHLLAGYTPLGGAFRWPEVSAHNQLFARFAAQIPPDAVVSTTSSLNPHLSHRRVLYRYLNVKDADYVLLDVSESEERNPIDFRVAYNALVNDKTFGVLDAADGYVLLKRGAPSKSLPDAFFSMFRARGRVPQYPVKIDFGDQVRFLGYDILNNQYGRASIRMYWQPLDRLDRNKNYELFLFYADDQGALREDLTLPSTLLFWYPTAMWHPDETVVGRTVPLDLGPRVRLGLAVIDGSVMTRSEWENTAIRLPARLIEPGTARVWDDSTWIELGTLKKVGNRYVKR